MTTCRKCGRNVDEETHYMITVDKWKGSRSEDGTLSVEHRRMKPEDSYLQLCSGCQKAMREWVGVKEEMGIKSKKLLEDKVGKLKKIGID